jgi:citrate lyase subunit alpha/citrate CoA-transferase
VKNAGLPLKKIEELKDLGEKICGKPEKAEFEDQIVSVVKWVDGTLLDIIIKVKK